MVKANYVVGVCRRCIDLKSLIVVLTLTIFATRSTSAQGITYYDSLGCWTSKNDSHGFYGENMMRITTVDDCLLYCWTDSSCKGIDWDPANYEARKCWVLNDLSSGTAFALGVTHYELNRSCMGCWSSPILSANVDGGQLVPGVSDIFSCQIVCYKSSSCIGIDFDSSNNCWLIFSGPLNAMNGVTHYILDRECNTVFTSPSSLSTRLTANPGSTSPSTTPIFSASTSTSSAYTTTTTSTASEPSTTTTITTTTTTISTSTTITPSTPNAPFPTSTSSSSSLSSSSPSPSVSANTVTTSATSSSLTSSTSVSVSANTVTTSATSSSLTSSTSVPTKSTSAPNEKVLSSEGTSFTLSFPPTATINNQSAIRLTICTTSADDVTVDIASQDSNIRYQQTVIVSLASCQVLDDIPLSFRPLLNSTQISYLSVTSSDVISVQTTLFGSCASYSAVPEAALGSVYYAVTLQPDVTANDAAFIFVAAPTLESTAVSVSFFLQTDVNSSWKNVTWCNGSNIFVTSTPPQLQATVEENTAICLMSKTADLSGTIIKVDDSSSIAVYTGNTAQTGRESNIANYVVTQLWPTGTWSKNFVAVTPAVGSNQYHLKIVGNATTTDVRINGVPLSSSSSGISYSNVYMRQNLTSSVLIESSQPVTVVQYPVDVMAAILLPGTESFRQQYSFVLPPVDDNIGGDYLVMAWSDRVVKNSRMLLNQQSPNEATEWQQLPVTSNSGSSYWSMFIPVEPGSYVMTIPPFGNVTFGAYVVRSNGRSCALGYPLAMGKKALFVKTTPRSPSLAIRPAYIVLAGLGGGILVLVAIAVILLCCYPISDENIAYMRKSSAVSSEVTGSTIESRATIDKKKQKKPKKTRQERQKELTQAYFGEGHIEMSESVKRKDNSSSSNNNHANENTAIVVPVQQHQTIEDNPAYDHSSEVDAGVYGNQKDIDRMSALEQRDSTKEF